MANRRPIQQEHERVYVGQFLAWFNSSYRSNFQVVDEPNPPEAIIRSSRTTRWVEVSTAFSSGPYAHDLYSFATPNETHKPLGSGPFMGMDESFAKQFAIVVKKKLEKTSYVPYREKYGPGYLVIPVMNQWFNEQTMNHMKEAWAACSVNDLGCFRSVFIATSSENKVKFSRWATRRGS